MGNQQATAIILAAGDGRRMKSARPKALCEVLFKPMLLWVKQACRAAGLPEVWIVAGSNPDALRAVAGADCHYCIQTERLGTGHAVMAAREALAGAGEAVVLYADAPFVGAQVIGELLRQHRTQKNAVTMVTAHVDCPTGYGRILRRADGSVSGIVEERDATPAERAITEINAGVYCFDKAFLRGALLELRPQNVQGEYYLTDTVAVAVAGGQPVGAYLCADGEIVLGANDRKGLRRLNEIARERELERQLENGVDIPCDDGVMIGPDVQIGQDTCILPGCILLGNTVIGSGCTIGPNSRIENSRVGDETRILSSYLTDSSVGSHATVGPFTQLRPNSHLGDRVKVGDFVEIKNATIGDGTSVAHLTYLGDSDIGKNCNFGCGVVTANYDGQKKYRTIVGDRAFIGCNTNLIPPVTVGDGAYTAAGTTVSGEIPAGALAIGRVPQQIKEHWADEHIGFKKNQK